MARLELVGLKIVEDNLDDQPEVRVVLSKRNLLALLHKVDQDWSQKTLENDYIYIDGELIDVGAVAFSIIAEPDEDHYGGRDAPPGPMIAATETFIHESVTLP